MFYTRFPSGVHGLSLYSFTFIFKLLIWLFGFVSVFNKFLSAADMRNVFPQNIVHRHT